MSRSLNHVQLIGNVGQDPEIRTTQNGTKVATLSLATSVSWIGADREKQERTEWHRCIVWNRGQKGGLADVVEQYVRKGDKLYASGKIEYRQWQDREGVTRYITEINVSELLMLGGKQGADNSQPQQPRQAQGGNRNEGANKLGNSRQANALNEFDDFPAALNNEDDDLPF